MPAPNVSFPILMRGARFVSTEFPHVSIHILDVCPAKELPRRKASLGDVPPRPDGRARLYHFCTHGQSFLSRRPRTLFPDDRGRLSLKRVVGPVRLALALAAVRAAAGPAAA
jgi:hypothetical protein